MNIEKVVIKLFALMVDVHTAEIGLEVAPQLYHNEQTKTRFAEHNVCTWLVKHNYRFNFVYILILCPAGSPVSQTYIGLCFFLRLIIVEGITLNTSVGV